MGQSVIDNWFLAFEQALLSSAERVEPRENSSPLTCYSRVTSPDISLMENLLAD